jgi:hypothetical protein
MAAPRRIKLRCSNCGRPTSITAVDMARSRRRPGLMPHSPVRGVYTLCRATVDGYRASLRVAGEVRDSVVRQVSRDSDGEAELGRA